MNKLPTEIFCKIISLLHHQDKIQCMLVCIEWEAIVNKTNLFSTLIISNTDCLNQLIQKFQQHPKKGAQVKNLVMNLTLDESFDLCLFTKFFPNLRFFSCRNKSNAAICYRLATQPWSNCIEQIIDEDAHSVVPNFLLSSTSFICLKRLSVRIIGVPVAYFIGLLSRVPNVSHLKMQCNPITFSELDLLHSTLPILESLDLKIADSFFIETSNHIEPANTIKSFSLSFDSVTKMDIQKTWFDYIRQKYTEMSSFTFNYFLSGCFGIDKENFYSDWFSPLFQELGPKLKSLSIQSDLIPSQLIKILDCSGCQVQHLKITSATPYLLDYFKDACHLDHIQTFEVTFHTCDIFEWMRKMTSLRKLSVFYFDSQSYFYLNDLLDMCSSTLSSLSIWIKQFDIDDHSVHTKEYPSIKSLTFSNTILPLGFDTFISNSFPNLRYLKLSECHFPEKTLRLSNLHLFHFEIEVCHFEKYYEILVWTLNNTEKRLYTFKMGYNSPLYPKENKHLYIAPFNSVPYNDAEHTPSLTLECFSICSLSILYKYF